MDGATQRNDGPHHVTRLTTLKPRLQTLSTNRIRTLEAKAGTTERIRGRTWLAIRDQVALEHGYRCACCGFVWSPERDEIDHRIPLEQGGSNDRSNLQPLCKDCHKAKTAREARARSGHGMA